ncbi:uncharacterized protein PAC_17860 [Phialocephala subalpina]|uniref:T6SS Phospholipase effector Tle1-like catalytic domain-containing protein n=1 Tax=Phialocephala subalpina TaxID=576137 RepID=A0A1L7XSD9_9HELO|nr:uncharacterized protein PAC_17860 [Phialocephala subalpina]
MAEGGVRATGAASDSLSKKRLIVCCDGTWNDSISTDSPLTNVSRISRLIKDTSEGGIPQVVYYQNGVGSGTSKPGNVIDGMSGRGISANIRDAYTFLCHNISHDSETQIDDIILIGFSRGAFTVRGVAALIEDVGLLTKSGLRSLRKVYDLWKIQPQNQASRTAAKQALNILLDDLTNAGERRLDFKIKVCAVWDTVGSLGFPAPGPIPQKASKRLAHINSKLCGNIEVAIQALALNERRKNFQATVWEAAPGQVLKQCWFLGAHSDVGGGNKDTGLANITLVWMLAQLYGYVCFNEDLLVKFTSQQVSVTNEEQSREFGLEINILPGDKVDAARATSAAPGITHSYRRTKTKVNILRSTGKVKNSFRGVFLFAGSQARKPCQYLMSEKGLLRNSKSNPTPTNETIHFTVRILLGTGRRTCAAMKKYHTSIVDKRVSWHLRTKRGRGTGICLAEDGFGDQERRLLRLWMDAEKDSVGTTSITIGSAVSINAGFGINAGVSVETSHVTIGAPEGALTTNLPLSSLLLPFLGEVGNPTILYPNSEKVFVQVGGPGGIPGVNVDAGVLVER